MPKVSKATAQAMDYGPVVDRSVDIEGYTISFTDFNQDIDGAPMLRGLPNDNCSCPHWGYVLAGRATFTFADHVEVYEEGDAFYVPPGHTPAHEAGNQLVLFSPAEQLKATSEALTKGTERLAQE
jgi:hypothetical protein